MRISDWSSDVCSSDLLARNRGPRAMSRTAVVLFNLGGPDRPEAVEPFLFNLFFDPAIIRLPAPLRWLVAKLLSRRRAPVAQAIYHEIDRKSTRLNSSH